MRILKIAAYVVGGLLALVVIALVAVVVFVDPNDYRDDIARIVEAETGRKLTLSGDLKLSVFPWVALETGPASLSDAPGFGDEPFVSIQDARVSVRLLPLLRGKIEVGKVALTQPRIRLITDSTGRQNWSDLGKDDGAPVAASEEPSQPAEVPTIAGLEIKDASVTIENRQENSRQVVRDFNLSTGRLASGEPFDFKTDFVFDQDATLSVKVGLASEVTVDFDRNVHRLADPTIDLTLTGQGYPSEGIPVRVRASSIESDIGKEIHRLQGLALDTTWKGEGFPASGVPVTVQAKELVVNLAAQTMESQDLYADIAGAKINAMLSGNEVLDAPRFTGRVALAPIELRSWLPKVGVELPKTRDPEVFKKLSFASNVVVTKTSAELQNITLDLDDTTATGSLAIADFAAKALRFDLKVNRIDADRYLPPPVEDAAAAKQGEQPPTEIPVEMLRKLNARGDLQIAEAVFSGVKFTKLRLGVNGRDGKVRFHPAQASMYGGTYSGDIGLDATGEHARVSLDEHVSNIDFAPLFKDFFETDRVSGKGNANIKLTGVGRTTDDVMKSLDGTIDFKVLDGALEGADLWYEIRRARAVLKQQAIPARSGPERTPFSALSGTGTMQDGILTNNDLDVSMQYLKVTGQGIVDIPKSALDYKLVATVLKIPREGADTSAEQDLVDAQIPVKVTGALTDPKVRPDIEAYLKGQVKEKLDKEKTKLEEKVKDKLGDKLKDLLGR
jgi:AsmA protein